jgi:sporadic carbohydrate cluster 2OG-Fe(II) oxygenase
VVQTPQNEAEELQIHSDVEGGNSPFEVTLWIPLVDVAGSKSMYVLDRTIAEGVREAMLRYEATDLRDLVRKLVRPEHFVAMRYGEALLFNPFLMHGNVTNETNTTRFTLNVRVKSMFSPYGGKTFLDYFEPVRLSPTSILGLEYERAHR